ncbi:MAG: antibiotic biosynthesis monooxygenase [Actinomycetota bacterium]
MTTLLAHITVKSGTEATWEDLCRKLHAETHSSESDVLRYEYWRGKDPQTYYCLLSFADHRAWIDHQASDHHEADAVARRECLDSIRLEFVDPVGGASDLPPTEQQDAPDGASELVAKYTERFQAQIADWWLALR